MKYAGFLLIFCLAAIQNAAAVDGKVACINMEKLLFEYHRTLDAKIVLYEASLKFVDETEADLKRIHNLEAEEKTQRAFANDHYKSEEAKKEHMKNADKLVVDIFNARRDASRSAMERRQGVLKTYQSESQKLRSELNAWLDTYAKTNNIQLIIDSSGQNRLRIPTVVYHRDATDVTDDVISGVNDGQAGRIAELKAKVESLKAEDRPTMDELIADLEDIPKEIRDRLQKLHALGMLDAPRDAQP